MTASDSNHPDPRSTVRSAPPIRGPVGGFRTLLQGLGMLMRERGLWLLASVPVVLALLALLAASVLIFENA